MTGELLLRRVEVGALKQDKSVPASRVKDKKDAPGKP